MGVSAVEFAVVANLRSRRDSTTYQQRVWEGYYDNGRAPTTPWRDLVVAVNAFLHVLDATSQEEWGSVASDASTATLDT